MSSVRWFVRPSRLKRTSFNECSVCILVTGAVVHYGTEAIFCKFRTFRKTLTHDSYGGGGWQCLQHRQPWQPPESPAFRLFVQSYAMHCLTIQYVELGMTLFLVILFCSQTYFSGCFCAPPRFYEFPQMCCRCTYDESGSLVE